MYLKSIVFFWTRGIVIFIDTVCCPSSNNMARTHFLFPVKLGGVTEIHTSLPVRRLSKSHYLTDLVPCPITVSLYVAWALSEEIMDQMSQRWTQGAKYWWKINLCCFKPLSFGENFYHRKIQLILMPYQKVLPQQCTRPQASVPGRKQRRCHQARLQRAFVLKKKKKKRSETRLSK